MARWLDTLLGRTTPKQPDLDALFSLPGAAVTLEAAAGLHPTGKAGVCFKPASGRAFEQTGGELDELLAFAARESGSTLSTSDDSYGYRWIVVDDPDLEDVVTAAHMVNTTLKEHGFGPQLLCSVFGFARPAGGDPCHLVYLYKRGTFYPFAPRAGEHRDNELELRVRGALGGDLPVEDDLTRWFPLWGAPV